MEIYPRHRRACEKLKALERMSSEYMYHRDLANSLMTQALFEKSQEHILQCMKAFPNNPETSELTIRCRKNLLQYSASMKEAYEKYRKKIIREAQSHVEKALAIASESVEASTLNRNLNNIIQTTNRLCSEVEQFMLSAQFSKSEESLQKIIDVQSDFEELSNLIQKLQDSKEQYTNCMRSANGFARWGNLEKKEQSLRGAIEICPNSIRAKSELEKVLASQAAAPRLIQESMELTQKACFIDALNALVQAEHEWAMADDFKALTEKVNKTKKEYDTYISKSQQEKTTGRIDRVLEFVKEALYLCPNSVAAIILRDKMTGYIAKVESLLKTSVSHLRGAQFEDAKKLIESSLELWPLNNKSLILRAEILSNERDYCNSLNAAIRLFHKKRYVAALQECRQALNISPDSTKALSLLENITTQRAQKGDLAWIGKFIEDHIVHISLLITLIIIILILLFVDR